MRLKFGFRARFRLHRRWRRPLPLRRQLFHRRLRRLCAARVVEEIERDVAAGAGRGVAPV